MKESTNVNSKTRVKRAVTVSRLHREPKGREARLSLKGTLVIKKCAVT